MEFTLDFNPAIYREQRLLIWQLNWKKNRSQNKRILLFGIILLMLGLIMIFQNYMVGIAVFIIGFYYCYSSFRYMFIVKKRKQRYKTHMEKNIERHLNNNDRLIYEFEEEYFRYKNFEFDIKIAWSAFSKYIIVEDNLFICLSDDIDNAYIIGKEEVGEEAFTSILQLTDSKLKKMIINPKKGI